MIRISFSQLNTLESCQAKYYYQYIEKYRDKYLGSALGFGLALDNAINKILEDYRDKKLTTLQDYKLVFRSFWEEQEINKVKVKLRTSPLVQYFTSDFDEDLLTDAVCAEINFKPNLKAFNAIKQQIKSVGIDNVHQDDVCTYNEHCWVSLLAKGYLILDTYFTEVLPQIKGVHKVQQPINITNSDSTAQIVGFIDGLLDLGDGVRVCDLKTSSTKYDEDSACISPQLGIYSYATGIKETAFIVLDKKINKKVYRICSECKNCKPRAITCNTAKCTGKMEEVKELKATYSIVKGHISKSTEDKVIDLFDEMVETIKRGEFTKNKSACFAYGRKCPYFNLCHKGSEEGLIKMEKKS